MFWAEESNCATEVNCALVGSGRKATASDKVGDKDSNLKL
jgi:hypothetical protein